MRIIHIQNELSVVDKLMVAGGIVGPLSTLPQIITIFSNQSANNVSLLSWLLYSLLSLIGLFYAFQHKEKILVIGYSLYLVADLTVVAGVIVYG